MEFFLTNKKIESERQNFMHGYIGDNDTGKSVMAQRRALAWRESRPIHHKIIAHDPQGRFPFCDYTINPNDDKWAERLMQLDRNGKPVYTNYLLILDDYRLINENPVAVKGLMALLYCRFKHNIDIIFICHNPALVINQLAMFTSHYFIFFTNTQDGVWQKKIPNYSYVNAASIEVNNYVAKHGLGSFPKCDFPFIYFISKTRQMIAINMKNKHELK